MRRDVNDEAKGQHELATIATIVLQRKSWV